MESSTVKYLLSNYALPQKMAGMRIETAEKLRKMSKGSISFNRFSQLKELARNSIGQGSDYDEEVIRSLINQIEIIDVFGACVVFCVSKMRQNPSKMILSCVPTDTQEIGCVSKLIFRTHTSAFAFCECCSRTCWQALLAVRSCQSPA